jgi:uncharacterized integral membrane protein
MSFKTIFIIACTALLTIFLTVNNDAVEFNFLIGQPIKFSKLIVIGVCILIGFILGYLAGRPRKTNDLNSNMGTNDSAANTTNLSGSSLSDEDRDYIS